MLLNVAAAIYRKMGACYDHNTALKLILSQPIYLMGTQSAIIAYRVTLQSQEVKVRLPLNLKNMREGSTVC